MHANNACVVFNLSRFPAETLYVLGEEPCIIIFLGTACGFVEPWHRIEVCLLCRHGV